MIYSLIRKLLFLLDPEQSHTIALQGLKLAHRLGVSRLLRVISHQPVTVMNLTFKNPIGLAAGLDKNADYVDALAALGFGFIEIGTVTPKPQAGNPKPRLFRLAKEEAIINRMGFNSKGVEYVAKQLAKIKYRGVLGINIGKNKDTPQDKSVEDYLIGFRALWQFASYITINISSPNTPGLRDLQQVDSLNELLSALKAEQKTLPRYVPLVVKISPDLDDQALNEVATVLLQQKIDGVIATNTTLSRQGVEDSPFAKEAGGLSGRPLCARSTEVIKQLKTMLQDRIPIIASGGVMDKTAIQEKFTAGASLVQVYSGFIYAGPGILKVS